MYIYERLCIHCWQWYVSFFLTLELLVQTAFILFTNYLLKTLLMLSLIAYCCYSRCCCCCFLEGGHEKSSQQW